MLLLPPNISTLHRHRDVIGLIKALKYSGLGNSKKIRQQAAEYLGSYPHVRVLEILMEMLISDPDIGWRVKQNVGVMTGLEYMKMPESTSRLVANL